MKFAKLVKDWLWLETTQMGVYPELEHLSLEALIDRWHEPPPDGEDYAVAYYDELAALLCDQGKTGIEFLAQAIANADTARLAAILFFLPPNHPALQHCSSTYLNDDRPLIVARAVDRLRIDHDTAAINQVLAQRYAPHPLVRSSVLRFVQQISPEAAMPILMEALQDPDELVRMSAIDELDDADLQNLSKTTQ